MIDKVTSYVQAGLDESLAHFVKGVFAAAVVAAAGYALKHATHFPATVQEIATYFVLSIPAVLSFWKWATTTASDQGPADASSVAAG